MSNSIRHRLYAALSFMLAGGIPGVFAILYDYDRYDERITPLSFFLFWYVFIPAVLSAISGFLFGADILNPNKVRSDVQAGVRGLIVSFVAWLAYVPILSSMAGTATNMSFLQKLLLLLVGGTLFIGWLIALVGIATGLLLYRHRKSSATSPTPS